MLYIINLNLHFQICHILNQICIPLLVHHLLAYLTLRLEKCKTMSLLEIMNQIPINTIFQRKMWIRNPVHNTDNVLGTPGVVAIIDDTLCQHNHNCTGRCIGPETNIYPNLLQL